MMEINEFENKIYKLFVDFSIQLRVENFYQKIQNKNGAVFFKDEDLERLRKMEPTGPTPLLRSDHCDLKKLAYQVVRYIKKMNEEIDCDEK